jgi:hypothetical protein
MTPPCHAIVIPAKAGIPPAVIPAKAGTHVRPGNMDPRFRGDDVASGDVVESWDDGLRGDGGLQGDDGTMTREEP